MWTKCLALTLTEIKFNKITNMKKNLIFSKENLCSMSGEIVIFPSSILNLGDGRGQEGECYAFLICA